MDEILANFDMLQKEISKQPISKNKLLQSKKAVTQHLSDVYLQQMMSLRDDLNKAAQGGDKQGVAKISKEIDEYMVRYVANILRSTTGSIHPMADPFRVQRVGGYVGADDTRALALGRPPALEKIIDVDKYLTTQLVGVSKKTVGALRAKAVRIALIASRRLDFQNSGLTSSTSG